jgi:hypothetical protein
MRVSADTIKTVVFIGRYNNGGFSPFGTGFLVHEKLESEIFRYTITAEYVLGKVCENGENEVAIAYNNGDGLADVSVTKYSDWLHHPDSSSAVDVAVYPGGPNENDVDFKSFGMDVFPAEGVLNLRDLGVGDEVIIPGLFQNTIGTRKISPIIRIGHVAAIPDEPIRTEYGQMDALLIQAMSIGGLSGSPVLLSVPAYRWAHNKTRSDPLDQRFYLIGLVHGHFDAREDDIDAVQHKAGGYVHSGIGVVVPYTRILETIKQDDMERVKNRARARMALRKGGT